MIIISIRLRGACVPFVAFDLYTAVNIIGRSDYTGACTRVVADDMDMGFTNNLQRFDARRTRFNVEFLSSLIYRMPVYNVNAC